MSNLELLIKQRNEIDKKIRQAKREQQTINGNVFMETNNEGRMTIRIKTRDLTCKARKTNACAILVSKDRGELADALENVIDDLKMIHRCLIETDNE